MVNVGLNIYFRLVQQSLENMVSQRIRRLFVPESQQKLLVIVDEVEQCIAIENCTRIRQETIHQILAEPLKSCREYVESFIAMTDDHMIVDLHVGC